MKTSLFKNFNEVVENKNIIEILNNIQSGTYKNQITYLRKSLADNKTEAAERAKKSLPAFTPSATFKGGRKMEFLQQYNQLVVLDIDKLSLKKLTETKQKAKENEFIFSVFISSSILAFISIFTEVLYFPFKISLNLSYKSLSISTVFLINFSLS